MLTPMRKRILAGLLVVCSGLLVACSGGGGGDSADGVQPGPPPPGGPVDPTPPDLPDPPPSPYAEAQRLIATITSVSLNGDNQAVVEFQLTDGSNIAITDLTVDDVRFVIAKLAASSLGNLTGNWQSYVNDIETAGSVGPGTQDRLQATYERDGEFVNNGDGTYVYTFATSLSDLPQEILDQAAVEGLDLSFEDDRTHRVAIQFDNSNSTANPNYDWVPATGALASFSRDIAATENCNACHDPLGIHGGNRREIEYCVTCHNPGSTDANSGNTVDMKVMVHKIHMGRDLPSVQDGGEYAIYGFRDSKHDYSDLGYPQDIRNCVNCHVGTGTVGEREDLVLTAQGDNWAEVASMAACGSCHEDLDFSVHAGGQEDDSGCGSCHSAGGPAGSIADSHRILSQEASARFAAEVVRVVNSMPGDVPRAVIAISNPETGERYDLHNDPEFEGGSVNVRVSWDTRDYHNTGNGAEDAGSISASALSGSTDNGNGTYSVSMPIALPDGSEPPGVAASGSGVAVVEGRLSLVLEEGADAETVPLVNAHGFFSIDEPDAVAVPRRDSVELGACLACHGSLSLHGGNRTDSINSCVTCHNPRNTDREVREIAADPPTDGKAEESLHFKTMIHGIHAAAMRENPLQIVGRNGGTTHVYDEEEVHYPGNLANCTACHGDSGFGLALADGVLGTTVDTGADHTDPADDTVVSPMAAACASCHDSDVAAAHMESQGASFATSQAALDSGAVVETCVVCHGEGKANDAWVSHQSFLD